MNNTSDTAIEILLPLVLEIQEQNRVSQEQNRVSQEQNRVSQEQNRVSQEQNRIFQLETVTVIRELKTEILIVRKNTERILANMLVVNDVEYQGYEGIDPFTKEVAEELWTEVLNDADQLEEYNHHLDIKDDQLAEAAQIKAAGFNALETKELTPKLPKATRKFFSTSFKPASVINSATEKLANRLVSGSRLGVSVSRSVSNLVKRNVHGLYAPNMGKAIEIVSLYHLLEKPQQGRRD